MLQAHKSKDADSPWWHGTLVKGGKSGWFPSNYVEQLQRGYSHEISLGSPLTCLPCLRHLAKEAKALYAYTGNTDEELPFEEGDVLNIVDSEDADWWKASKDGVVFIVPAAYLELCESLLLMLRHFLPSSGPYSLYCSRITG